MMAEAPPFLLDVRETSELEEKGCIEGAVNIPLRQVLDDVEILPAFDTPIVSYCGSGWRCTIAMTVLEALGFEDVLSLKGGSYSGWVEAGYPVVEALNAELAENPDLILIDVRKPEELAEQGVIDAPNVIHIPLEEFVNMKAEWPADLDAPIVVYCGSGHRSRIAMAILWAYGYTDVRSLKDGFSGWVEAGYPIADYAEAGT